MQTTTRLWNAAKTVAETATLIAALTIWLSVWSILLFFWEVTHI